MKNFLRKQVTQLWCLWPLFVMCRYVWTHQSLCHFVFVSKAKWSSLDCLIKQSNDQSSYLQHFCDTFCGILIKHFEPFSVSSWLLSVRLLHLSCNSECRIISRLRFSLHGTKISEKSLWGFNPRSEKTGLFCSSEIAAFLITPNLIQKGRSTLALTQHIPGKEGDGGPQGWKEGWEAWQVLLVQTCIKYLFIVTTKAQKLLYHFPCPLFDFCTCILPPLAWLWLMRIQGSGWVFWDFKCNFEQRGVLSFAVSYLLLF